MNYYLYNDTYIACSRVPKSNIENYQEITQEQYCNCLECSEENEEIYTTFLQKDLTFSGDLKYFFSNGLTTRFYNKFQDKIKFKNISNLTYLCYGNTLIENINLNIDNLVYATGFSYAFMGCNNLKNIDINFSQQDIEKLKTISTSSPLDRMFANCNRLRAVPEFYKYLKSETTSTSTSISTLSTPYNYTFYCCRSLGEITDIPVYKVNLTSNSSFSYFVNNCNRIKNLIFQTDESNDPIVVNWKNQCLDLTIYVGYTDSITVFIDDYNSKRVTDESSYELLKDDPDWWTSDIRYSRYNHDSAVATINSLPDCSNSDGTNIIKFKGQSGELTDGGAINTLTEDEIAVATLKGWVVTLS